MADTTHTANPRDIGQGSTGQDLKNKAQGAVSSAMDTVKGVAGATADKAKQVASAVGHKAEDAMAATASGMRSLGDSIKSGGEYLKETDLKGMGEDFVNLIRRNPIPSLFVGFALGFLLSRAFRS